LKDFYFLKHSLKKYKKLHPSVQLAGGLDPLSCLWA